MSRTIRLLAVAALFAIVGCGKQPTAVDNAADEASHEAAHAHGDAPHGDAPHGGTLADWGGGAYHVEFTVDHDAKSSTVYVLGDDAKTPSPVKADKLLLTIQEPSFQVELTPEPPEGETDGASSRFTGSHDNLGIVREFAGTISGDVDGTPYAADFAEVAGEHRHDH